MPQPASESLALSEGMMSAGCPRPFREKVYIGAEANLERGTPTLSSSAKVWGTLHRSEKRLGGKLLAMGRPSASLHESLEYGASFGNLWQAGVRTFEVREKFLVLIDGLIAFPGALVDLAEIVVGEEFSCGEALPNE